MQNSYTQAVADSIIEQLSEGTPLSVICRQAGMPKVRTVSDWRKANKDFDQKFLQAREDGFDALAAEALHIADTPKLGIITKRTLDGVETVEDDMLGHRKLQVETRLKLLSKWDPRRYGDKLDLNHGGAVSFSLSVRRRFSANEERPPE